jgi:UDP-glucose 4-epimerase
MARAVPLMDTTRALTDLGWKPEYGSDEALVELLDGIHDGADFSTPPLARETGGVLRIKESRCDPRSSGEA